MKPLVSIIIPTLNRADSIIETLNSVLAQTYENWECIVVDDGSTDGTEILLAEYCKKDERFRYVHRPADQLAGGNVARNHGFKISKGQYIQWFDSDDLMHPDKLEKNLEQFKLNPSIVISICSVIYFSEKERKERLINMHTVNLYEDYVLKKIAVSCQVPLWSKKFLEKEELFNPMTLRGQEYELYTKLFYKVKSSFGLIAEPLVYIRKNQNSITKTFFKGDDKYLESYMLVLENIIRNIINQRDKLLYKEFLKVYYKNVVLLVKVKKYDMALKAILFLFNNNLKEKSYFKINLIKKYFLILLIKASKGKLYYRLKNNIHS